MKIAYSGTHGTGKTTSVYHHAADLKIDPAYANKNVGIVYEVARHSPFPLNKESTHETQLWGFCTQIAMELEYKQKYDIIICDRTIMDPIAYAIVLGYQRSADTMWAIAEEHIHSYDRIIYKSPDNNNYCFADGIRDIDNKFRLDVHETLIGLYNKLKIEIEIQ